MYRRAATTIISLIAIAFCVGCGSATKPSADIGVTPVITVKPPEPKLNHCTASVGLTGEKIPFTMVLPPAWTWNGEKAEKLGTSPLTMSVWLTVSELPDDEKAEQPSAAARRQLVELADGKMLNDFAAGEKAIIRDRRIIQVAESDAVWDVVGFYPDGASQPTRLEARCYLKIGNKRITIEGRYFNEDSDRIAADPDESQEELLKITQSFYIGHGEPTESD